MCDKGFYNLFVSGPIAQVVERPADNGEVSRSSRLRPTRVYMAFLMILFMKGM